MTDLVPRSLTGRVTFTADELRQWRINRDIRTYRRWAVQTRARGLGVSRTRQRKIVARAVPSAFTRALVQEVDRFYRQAVLAEMDILKRWKL